MKDEATNTLRPRNFPADIRAIVREALWTIADELDGIRDLAANGNLAVLQDIGALKADLDAFMQRVSLQLESDHTGHGETQRMLGQLMGGIESRDADFEAFRNSTNEAIAELKRKMSNGHAT